MVARTLGLLHLLHQAVDEVSSLILIFSTSLIAGKICIAGYVRWATFAGQSSGLDVVDGVGRERIGVILIVNSAVYRRIAYIGFLVLGRDGTVTLYILRLIIQYLIVQPILDI